MQKNNNEWSVFESRMLAPIEEASALVELRHSYENKLEGYIHKSITYAFYNNDPNQGYKFHLYVKPENVVRVATFLKQGDYHHKYLSGADIEDGKIFTVYTGSKQQTEQIIRAVAASEVAAFFEEPIMTIDKFGQVPFAPNIMGRFVGDKNNYVPKVPVLGLSVLRTAFQQSLSVDEQFQATNKALLSQYGDYYGGGITYYHPS